MAGYIGTTPVPQATQHRESFTATGGQTSFATVGYTPQFIDVYLNGVKLAPADFTATNGSDVVLASGATASDILEIVAYTPFEVANQTFTGTTTANNFTVTGAFTSQGIDDNADAVAITIDSSENVGIGTTSPSEKLHINEASTNASRIRLSNTDGYLEIGTNNQVSNLDSQTHTFRNEAGSTEYMRIDSSGNLLVGTTTILAAESNVEGISLAAGSYGGLLSVSRDGNRAATFNRKTSDGDIVEFRKDGTTVGSIGTAGGRVYLADDATNGITFSNSSAIMWPSNSSGGVVDNTMDIGSSSYRFKDLYLSGGVYLGGTGSANKLDDYEEGTWTPFYHGSTGNPTCTYDIQAGYYTKVGRQVNCHGRIRTDAVSGGSGLLSIGGLPFTGMNVNGNGSGGTVTIGSRLTFKSGEFGPEIGYVTEQTTTALLRYFSGTNTAGNCDVAALDNTTNDNDIMFSISFITTE
tara:strand:+ start:202 stop:1599 length:1398 start_codon:yes stop_codon:yes gene_type:complete